MVTIETLVPRNYSGTISDYCYSINLTKSFNNKIIVIFIPIVKISYYLDKSLFLYLKSLSYNENLQLWQNIFNTQVLGIWPKCVAYLLGTCYLPNSCLDIEYKKEKDIVPILKEFFLWGKGIDEYIKD